MSNWADELRALLVANEDTIWAALEINIRALVATGERQLEHALNTIECLVEANAALREQLCSLKAERGEQKRAAEGVALRAKVDAEDKRK